MFALAGTDSQEIPEFIEPAAEASSRPGVLEAAHGSVSVLDSTVILFEPVVQVGIGPVPDRLTEFAPDRCGIGIVTIRRYPVRDSTGHRFGGAEKCLGSREIAALAEHYIHQSTVAVDGPV